MCQLSFFPYLSCAFEVDSKKSSTPLILKQFDTIKRSDKTDVGRAITQVLIIISRGMSKVRVLLLIGPSLNDYNVDESY